MGASCYKDLQGIKKRINVHPQVGYLYHFPNAQETSWKREARKTVGQRKGWNVEGHSSRHDKVVALLNF